MKVRMIKDMFIESGRVSVDKGDVLNVIRVLPNGNIVVWGRVGAALPLTLKAKIPKRRRMEVPVGYFEFIEKSSTDLLELWKKRRKNLIREVLKKYAHGITDAKLNAQVGEEVVKIKHILDVGLDVGGIIRNIVDVELYEYKGEIYFKDKKNKSLHSIDEGLKQKELPAQKELDGLLK